jgi:hypothetical protein
MEMELTDTDFRKNDHNTLSVSQPVDGNIGELFLKTIIHEVFIFVFGICFCAGPAAEIYLCSGSFDIEVPAAGEAFFFYVRQEVYPLSFHVVKLK